MSFDSVNTCFFVRSVVSYRELFVTRSRLFARSFFANETNRGLSGSRLSLLKRAESSSQDTLVIDKILHLFVVFMIKLLGISNGNNKISLYIYVKLCGNCKELRAGLHA